MSDTDDVSLLGSFPSSALESGFKLAQAKVTIIDSGGVQHERKLSWVLRKHDDGLCFQGCDGIWRFRMMPQDNGHRGKSANLEITSIDAETAKRFHLTYGSGGFSFLPYPQPRQSTGPLRLRYPALARAGAGLR